MFGGVSLGTNQGQFAREETLLLTGVHASHPANGCVYVRLVAAPSQGVAKTGDDTKDVIMNALRKLLGGGLSGARLRSSLV